MEQQKLKQAQTKRKKHKKRRRKVGRPKGCKLKPFEQTRIGFLLQHEAPLEYGLLMDAMDLMKFRTPPADLIESISYASSDPLFRKPKFRRCLIEYRKYGLHPPVAIKTNVKKELYYIRIRLKKLEEQQVKKKQPTY